MDGIVAINIALVEEHAEVVATEEHVADGVDGQVLHDDKVQQVAVGLVTIGESSIV